MNSELSPQYLSEVLRFRDDLAQCKLTPWQYCLKWVPLLYGVYPEDRNFKSQCYSELSRITGAQIENIQNNWLITKERNNVPEYAYALVSLWDKMNFVLINARLIKNSSEFLSKMVGGD